MNIEYITSETMQLVNNAVPYVATFAAGWIGNNLYYNTKKRQNSDSISGLERKISKR